MLSGWGATSASTSSLDKCAPYLGWSGSLTWYRCDSNIWKLGWGRPIRSSRTWSVGVGACFTHPRGWSMFSLTLCPLGRAVKTEDVDRESVKTSQACEILMGIRWWRMKKYEVTANSRWFINRSSAWSECRCIHAWNAAHDNKLQARMKISGKRCLHRYKWELIARLSTRTIEGLTNFGCYYKCILAEISSLTRQTVVNIKTRYVLAILLYILNT